MRLIFALSSVAAVIALTGPAYADANQDQAFLAAVKSAGITFENADKVVAAGAAVCEMAKSPMPAAEVVKTLQEQNPGLDQTTAAQFTAITFGVYCPDLIPGDRKGGSGGS